jgi:hypothetical protein
MAGVRESNREAHRQNHLLNVKLRPQRVPHSAFVFDFCDILGILVFWLISPFFLSRLTKLEFFWGKSGKNRPKTQRYVFVSAGILLKSIS